MHAFLTCLIQDCSTKCLYAKLPKEKLHQLSNKEFINYLRRDISLSRIHCEPLLQTQNFWQRKATEFLLVSDCITFVLYNNPTLHNCLHDRQKSATISVGKLQTFFNTLQQVWLQHFYKIELQNSLLINISNNGDNNEK